MNLSMKRTSSYASYPLESKVEAVRLFRKSGKPLQEVADELGVRSNSLR
jgi:transposase-like protein